MAVLTNIRRQNVGRILAGGNYAVVAGAARAQDLRMVDNRHRRKRACAVAILADVGRLYMRRVLAGRFGTVVAAETIRRDIRVIEIHR